MRGIDCTARITPEIAQELVRQDIKYVARYLVPEYPSLLWKRLTAQEAQVMSDNGIKILSVYEIDVGDTKGGYASGMIHGQAAYKEAKAIGQPEGTAIFFTVDYEAAEFDSIEQFLIAVKEQLPGYKVGVYGSYYVTEEMAKRGACDYFWQTYAWSNGNLSEIGRDVYQYENGVQLAGIEVDLDDFYIGEDSPVCWSYIKETQAVPCAECEKLRNYFYQLKEAVIKNRNELTEIINQFE